MSPTASPLSANRSMAVLPEVGRRAGSPVGSLPTSGRRRRSGMVRLLVAAGALVALAGCTVPSNAPTAYDDAVKANFVQGCVGDIPETNNTTTTLAASDFCGCAYDIFVDQVPFNDDARSAFPNYPTDAPTFTTFNDELTKSDTPQSVWETLPQPVRDDLATCPVPPGPVAPGGTSTTTPGNESTTTTAAG